jgi:hypothetical protein
MLARAESDFQNSRQPTAISRQFLTMGCGLWAYLRQQIIHKPLLAGGQALAADSSKCSNRLLFHIFSIKSQSENNKQRKWTIHPDLVFCAAVMRQAVVPFPDAGASLSYYALLE